jgi:hypothetical protein
MVILVAIICITISVAFALGVGWLMRRLRQRDERENEKLRLFQELDQNLKSYADEQKNKSDGGNS